MFRALLTSLDAVVVLAPVRRVGRPASSRAGDPSAAVALFFAARVSLLHLGSRHWTPARPPSHLGDAHQHGFAGPLRRLRGPWRCPSRGLSPTFLGRRGQRPCACRPCGCPSSKRRHGRRPSTCRRRGCLSSERRRRRRPTACWRWGCPSRPNGRRLSTCRRGRCPCSSRRRGSPFWAWRQWGHERERGHCGGSIASLPGRVGRQPRPPAFLDGLCELD